MTDILDKKRPEVSSGLFFLAPPPTPTTVIAGDAQRRAEILAGGWQPARII